MEYLRFRYLLGLLRLHLTQKALQMPLFSFLSLQQIWID